jgi:hypothetical protein
MNEFFTYRYTQDWKYAIHTLYKNMHVPSNDPVM